MVEEHGASKAMKLPEVIDGDEIACSAKNNFFYFKSIKIHQ